MSSHFFQRGQALHDFHEAGATQVYHAFLIGHVHDINFRTVVHNDFLHFIADRHDFINADAAFKAFAAAAVAANRAVELPILSQVRIGKAGFFSMPEPAGAQLRVCSLGTVCATAFAP